MEIDAIIQNQLAQNPTQSYPMTDTNILQYNCGNSNGDKAKPGFDSIDPSRFPILAIQEPMVTERNPGYTYTPRNYRTSRPVSLGMRVVFMIHDKVPLTAWKHVSATDYTELLQVSLNGTDLQIINIYSPPGPPSAPTIDKWEELEQVLRQTKPGNLLLIGDLNCHHPAWGGRRIDPEPRADHLIKRLERFQLTLLNQPGTATWGRGGRDSTIDLGFATPGLIPMVMKYKPHPE
ncbi:DNase I-like protein [Aulographum hederae CBS 113979]|uniref:DNase I-like protein n=1 Tax=Aulographum hederae CBS 113979 TaxID=1176131 RepID=A0A6G1HCJ4_9PEZI|nr:DNase I-like protein [Aulographum hederae CBS 113979]